MNNLSVSIVGGGNVAFHLIKACQKSDVYVNNVFTRTDKSYLDLVKNLSYTPSFKDSLSYQNKETDIILIAVTDSAIESVASNIKAPDEVVVSHTSAMEELSALSSRFTNAGIFYPLQSFSKNRPLDYKGIPLLLECSNNYTEKKLNHLAQRIFNNSYAVNYERRSKLHLAAVFANNFTNHLLNISDDLLDRDKNLLNLLSPLMEETMFKIFENGPAKSQTGPAIRNDMNTIDKHLNILKGKPEAASLYYKLTESIQKYHLKR
ncbi:MAG TPA: Rossmann-like and DUF2520 domain-containing protein [Cyclobacteriaceae bacterium]